MAQGESGFLLPHPHASNMIFSVLQNMTAKSMKDRLELATVVEPQVQVYEWACQELEQMTKRSVPETIETDG